MPTRVSMAGAMSGCHLTSLPRETVGALPHYGDSCHFHPLCYLISESPLAEAKEKHLGRHS